jgi:transcriptional regulator with XRE-family HTH domain
MCICAGEKPRKTNLKSLGPNVRELREEQSISRRQLARRSKVGLRTLAAIEDSETNPRIETVGRIADALGASVDAMLGRCS